MSFSPILLAVAVALGASQGVRVIEPEPGMTWGYSPANGPQDDGALAFGVDGTDAVQAILRCRPGSGRIVISTFPDAAAPSVIVQLKSGAAISRHRAHVEPNEAADGVLVEVVVPARDMALRAFRRGGRLSVGVGRERTDLPAARRSLTAKFFRSCGG